MTLHKPDMGDRKGFDAWAKYQRDIAADFRLCVKAGLVTEMRQTGYGVLCCDLCSVAVEHTDSSSGRSDARITILEHIQHEHRDEWMKSMRAMVCERVLKMEADELRPLLDEAESTASVDGGGAGPSPVGQGSASAPLPRSIGMRAVPSPEGR